MSSIEIISFETAKLAKEKGFSLNVWHYYGNYYSQDDNNQTLQASGSMVDMNTASWAYSAPTQHRLQKWLREEHDIDISVEKSFNEISMGYYRYYGYHARVTTSHKVNKVYPEDKWEEGWYGEICDNYEDALESGLQKALDLV